MRHKCDSHASLHDESVHMLKCLGASIVDLISAPRSVMLSSFLMPDASWALLVGHIKSNDEQISRAAGRALLLPAVF
jgi:hypothetical protein